MNAGPQDTTLDEIRREIDAIDDGLLDLLARRFQASARVRGVKTGDGTLRASPIRPAREAEILRRLMARRDADVAPETLVRLWRVILTSSTLAQAAVTVHLPAAVNETPPLRDAVTLHFAATPVVVHEGAAAAIDSLGARPGDVAVVTPQSGWTMALTASGGKVPRVIGVLPQLSAGREPLLLILGHAPAQPSGDDRTLLVGIAPWHGAAAPDWQIRAGTQHVVCLPGFLDEAMILRDLAPLGWRLAGRYPTPLKVPS
jgi:chorismate mutase